MSWITDLFKKKPKDTKAAPSFSGFWPLFTQFGTNIYASDAVQQALACIVTEMKKLNPVHVRTIDNDPMPIKGNIKDLLDNPNQLMTTADFIERTTWLLLMNYNAFIIPTFYEWTDEKTGQKRRYYDGLYPINPIQVDFIEDATGRLFVTFMFRNAYETTIPYDDVIHIRKNYSLNEYMGGNEMGQPDHAALLETLNINKELLHGIAKAMKSSYAVNGIIKYNTMLADETMEKNLHEFEAKLRNSESGILPIDIKNELTMLPRNVALVDEPTLKFIDEKILRNFGVPLCILRGDYSKEQYAAFYQRTIEPLVIAFSQALTKKLFTPRERAFGNKIELYPKDLVFMTVEQTLELVNILAPTGAMYENEKRAAFGLRPLEELQGKRYISLNWIEATNAQEYQIGRQNESGAEAGSGSGGASGKEPDGGGAENGGQ